MFSKLRRRNRQNQLRSIETRIAQLTEAIDGTDELLYPDVVRAHCDERQRLAIKRVNLLNALERE